ncbi:regulator of chromosome condensation 1/beta-lactamase-inhibitor protein II [Phaeosphaeria sp. MPI-PUGE-AT-0046c]|nr:regulator of chromosome condensation 1/beta-lactamase-inhibitor protein II [Phaeosphaeria sp. MPI-PUGE-AT-0046c]
MPRQLYVFGSNGEGQLGIPAAEIVSTPTMADHSLPLESLESICGGDNHTLFLTEQQEAFGVGDNRKLQLASGPEQPSLFEACHKLDSGVSYTAATCESSACIKTLPDRRQSQVLIRGAGHWGELGVGDDNAHCSITIPGAVIDFAAGVWHYVVLLEDGSVYGWGKARLGQLGDQLAGKVLRPIKIENTPFAPKRVVCGKDFTYLVGDASTGEHLILGKDKFNIISGMPPNINGWKDVGATWHSIFVLLHSGKLIAWGRNTMWELIPPGLPLIDKIAIGSEHVLALTKDGKLLSWGWGKHGNCGDLSKLQEKIENDMITGFWNEIDLPGRVEFIGAGYCTSFVVTQT